MAISFSIERDRSTKKNGHFGEINFEWYSFREGLEAIHKRRHQSRGRWVCQFYLISLFNKINDEGGRGIKNLK